MRKIVLTYSIIAGIITAGMIFVTMTMAKNGIMEPSMLVGYTIMVIALAVIFPAVKNYRDKEQNGVIKFGKAFAIGMYISLIACAIYALGWELYIASTGKTAIEIMTGMYAAQIEEMKAAGATAKELAQYQMPDWYNSLVPRYLFTMFGEMFPVGLIISLICAGLLKKKPQSATA